MAHTRFDSGEVWGDYLSLNGDPMKPTVTQFERDGLLASVDVMPAARADVYAEKYRAFIDRYQGHPDYSRWTYGKTELLLRWVVQLASEQALLDTVETLIGPDILLWNAFLPAKPPRSQGHFGWHQDATYWPVTPTEQIVSVWVALGPVNQHNGAMQMVRGSHRLGAVPHEKTFDKHSMLRRGQRTPVDEDDPKIVDIKLLPGQASFHHTLTLHRSRPNRSDQWRLGVGLNYAAAEVGPLPGHSDTAMLLRGSCGSTGFVLEDSPDFDLSPTAIARFEAAERPQRARYADATG